MYCFGDSMLFSKYFILHHNGWICKFYLCTTLNPEGYLFLYVVRKTRSNFKVGIQKSWSRYILSGLCYWFFQRIRSSKHFQIHWSLHCARCGYCDRMLPKGKFHGCSAHRWHSFQRGWEEEGVPIRARNLSDRRHNQALCPSMFLRIYCHLNALSWKGICVTSWGMDGNRWAIISRLGCLQGTGLWIGPTHWCSGRPGWICWQKVL